MTKSRSQQRAGGGRSESRRVISINREPEVQLSKAENPYKPAYMQPKPATVEGECAVRDQSLINKYINARLHTTKSCVKLQNCFNIIFLGRV